MATSGSRGGALRPRRGGPSRPGGRIGSGSTPVGGRSRRAAAAKSALLLGATWPSGYDASSDRVAVLDARGTIVAVNAAWRAFAREAGPDASALGEGAPYLTACDEAGDEAVGPQAIAAAIRAALRGARGE